MIGTIAAISPSHNHFGMIRLADPDAHLIQFEAADLKNGLTFTEQVVGRTVEFEVAKLSGKRKRAYNVRPF